MEEYRIQYCSGKINHFRCRKSLGLIGFYRVTLISISFTIEQELTYIILSILHIIPLSIHSSLLFKLLQRTLYIHIENIVEINANHSIFNSFQISRIGSIFLHFLVLKAHYLYTFIESDFKIIYLYRVSTIFTPFRISRIDRFNLLGFSLRPSFNLMNIVRKMFE